MGPEGFHGTLCLSDSKEALGWQTRGIKRLGRIALAGWLTKSHRHGLCHRGSDIELNETLSRKDGNLFSVTIKDIDVQLVPGSFPGGPPEALSRRPSK